MLALTASTSARGSDWYGPAWNPLDGMRWAPGQHAFTIPATSVYAQVRAIEIEAENLATNAFIPPWNGRVTNITDGVTSVVALIDYEVPGVSSQRLDMSVEHLRWAIVDAGDRYMQEWDADWIVVHNVSNDTDAIRWTVTERYRGTNISLTVTTPAMARMWDAWRAVRMRWLAAGVWYEDSSNNYVGSTRQIKDTPPYYLTNSPASTRELSLAAKPDMARPMNPATPWWADTFFDLSPDLYYSPDEPIDSFFMVGAGWPSYLTFAGGVTNILANRGSTHDINFQTPSAWLDYWWADITMNAHGLQKMKQILKSIVGDFVDPWAADGDSFESYFSSLDRANPSAWVWREDCTSWVWQEVVTTNGTVSTNLQFACAATNRYWDLERYPEQFPVMTVSSLCENVVGFPHQKVETVVTNDVPGWMVGQTNVLVVPNAVITNVTYTSTWFDWTPDGDIFGVETPHWGRYVTSQWLVASERLGGWERDDNGDVLGEQSPVHGIVDSAGNSARHRLRWTPSIEDGLVESVVIELEYRPSPSSNLWLVVDQKSVTHPTNVLMSSVVTNTAIAAGYTAADYGWPMLTNVVSAMRWTVGRGGSNSCNTLVRSESSESRTEFSYDCGSPPFFSVSTNKHDSIATNTACDFVFGPFPAPAGGSDVYGAYAQREYSQAGSDIRTKVASYVQSISGGEECGTSMNCSDTTTVTTDSTNASTLASASIRVRRMPLNVGEAEITPYFVHPRRRERVRYESELSVIMFTVCDGYLTGLDRARIDRHAWSGADGSGVSVGPPATVAPGSIATFTVPQLIDLARDCADDLNDALLLGLADSTSCSVGECSVSTSYDVIVDHTFSWSEWRDIRTDFMFLVDWQPWFTATTEEEEE